MAEYNVEAIVEEDMATMQTEVQEMLAKEGVRREDTAQVWLNRYSAMSLVSVFSLCDLPALPVRVSISDLYNQIQSLINH